MFVCVLESLQLVLRGLQPRANETKQQRSAAQQLTMKLVLRGVLEQNRTRDIHKLVWLAIKFVGSRVKKLPHPDEAKGSS